MASISPPLASVPESVSFSSKELCTFCGERPYDVICACGDKFDFTCIHFHVEHIGREFHYAHSDTGEQLLYAEQIVEDNNCEHAKTLVENWKRKRIQDVTDIADEVLKRIEERQNISSDVTSFRTVFNFLSESTQGVHDQLHAILALQRQIKDKYDQLHALSDLACGDISLDTTLLSCLNPGVLHQATIQEQARPIDTASQPITIDESEATPTLASPAVHELEPVRSSVTVDTAVPMSAEVITSTPTPTPTASLNPAATPTTSASNLETMNQLQDSCSGNCPTDDSALRDDFDAGCTAYIQRQNAMVIPAGNDKFASTVCCHDNQLLFNNYHQRSRQTRLTLIPDITQPAERRIIEWTPPTTVISSGDDDWIQDITYCNRLQGYLLLSRARLRLLRSDTYELEEFSQFPDSSMKRVTCAENHIYLVCAAGPTGQHRDEVILLNYDGEEKRRKTFRDLIFMQHNHVSGPLIGQISDLAISTKGQVMLAYRNERRRQVSMYICNVTTDGQDWEMTKRVVLSECWMEDLPYTPRTKWCEKLGVFVVVEFCTGHLIMVDETGQVKGECHFTAGQDQSESPLNISVSENNWLCARYESSVNIYRLEETTA